MQWDREFKNIFPEALAFAEPRVSKWDAHWLDRELHTLLLEQLEKALPVWPMLTRLLPSKLTSSYAFSGLVGTIS